MTDARDLAAAKADLEKPYDPREVEERWYAFWEKEGVFDAVDDAVELRAETVEFLQVLGLELIEGDAVLLDRVENCLRHDVYLTFKVAT